MIIPLKHQLVQKTVTHNSRQTTQTRRDFNATEQKGNNNNNERQLVRCVFEHMKRYIGKLTQNLDAQSINLCGIICI